MDKGHDFRSRDHEIPTGGDIQHYSEPNYIFDKSLSCKNSKDPDSLNIQSRLGLFFLFLLLVLKEPVTPAASILKFFFSFFFVSFHMKYQALFSQKYIFENYVCNNF